MTAISVVVFGYRSEKTIVRAVRSLVEQNTADIAEVIVVTSGGDRSAERVWASYPGARVIERSERLLPGAACNVGLREAKSPIVTFLASDCVAEAGWIARRVELHAVKRRAVACAISNGGPNSPAGWAAHYLLFASRLPGRLPGRVIPPDPAIHGLSVPRDELLEIGGFREDLRIGEDTDLAWRLHARGLEMFFHGSIRTAHFGPGGTIAMLGDQFGRGMRRARTRARTKSAIRLLIGTPRDVLNRVSWVVAEAWRHARVERSRIVLILPWLTAGAAANCAGCLREQFRMPRIAPSSHRTDGTR